MTEKPADNYPLAFGYSIVNAMMLSFMGLFAKLLSDFFDPVQVTFFRNIISLLLLVGAITLMGRLSLLRTARPISQFLRALVGTIGIVIGMWSYALLDLTQATMLFFTSPLFTVMLSALLLKEKIGIYRFSAVFTGFCGVAVICWPLDAMPLLGVAVGLGNAFFAALVDICLRWIGKTEHALTTVFYFLFLSALMTGIYIPFSDFSAVSWSATLGLFVLGIGISGVLSLTAKTQSYRLAPASMIAPVTFTMVIWAALLDYALWDKIPSAQMIAGGTIIVASNLFIIWRQHRLKLRIAPHE